MHLVGFTIEMRFKYIYLLHNDQVYVIQVLWLLAGGKEMELEFHLVPARKQPPEPVWYIPDAVCTVLDSWWWTETPPETCRVLLQNKINLRYCASGWLYYRNILRCAVLQTSNLGICITSYLFFSVAIQNIQTHIRIHFPPRTKHNVTYTHTFNNKFNIVHFPWRYIKYIILNANLLHHVLIYYLLLRDVSASFLGHYSLFIIHIHRLRQCFIWRNVKPRRLDATNYISVYLTLRLLMSYKYGAPILDVSRSHTTTQHSR